MIDLREIKKHDKELYEALVLELERQNNNIELIASENIVSPAVMIAMGSHFTNKYAEGYPEKRYYGGCEYVDIAENLAIERAKKLFNAKFANVQPHSGAQANTSVYFALLSPGDKILGMELSHGGHLTHGSPVSISGKWFDVEAYGVSKEDGKIDYDALEQKVMTVKPKLIICGASAYPRFIDFKRFREIADKVGAYLMADMAHIAGLVAAKLHQNPMDYCHVVTTTTHKTLRGPRGGMILTNDENLAKAINKAVFPGIQGGPLMHVIASKALAFKEALSDDFVKYQKQIVKNSAALAKKLLSSGVNLVSGGTDNHLMLLDLRSNHITGKELEVLLDKAHITANKNTIPFDPEKPSVASGLRIGTPAITSRGMKGKEMEIIGDCIVKIIKGREAVVDEVSKTVLELTKKFPIYEGIFDL